VIQEPNANTPIAIEGLPFIAGALLATAVFFALGWTIPAAFGLLVTLFIAFFFRNPQRITPLDEQAVVAPADGRVIYLGPAEDEVSGQEMTKISIFMSVFNVHVNRAPLTGRVTDTFYVPGKFLDVRDQRATFENERRGIVLATAGGARIVVVQVAGLIARRIICYLEKGDEIGRGQRYGLIRFGSRLDVYLPKEADVRVRLDQKTVAGETVLGILP
jgi:phosphatidylserine decarboxylase